MNKKLALLSVSDKTGIVDFAAAWSRQDTPLFPPAEPKMCLTGPGCLSAA